MSVDLRLPGRPESVARARRALDDLGPRVSPALQADLRLLVSEVVTNAIRHGADTDGDDRVRLVIVTDEEHVRVEVTDPGPGFSPPETGHDRERAGGWGLWLVEQLADRWGIRGRDGTCVWFELGYR